MNLFRVLATVSGMTMVSRVTGLIRENLMARIFGASVATDAFFVAFRIPNLLRRLFAEGAFSQAFVPILGEFKAQRSADETRQLVDHVATVLTWTLVIVAVLGIVGTPAVVWLLAGGLKAERCGLPATDAGKDGFDLAVLLTRIMFPYIALIGLVAGASAILNTWRRFAVPAFTPVLLNLSFIVASLFVAKHVDPPVLALAFAVVVGGIAQLAFQIPALIRVGMLPRIGASVRALRTALADPGVRRVLRQMVPATFAVSIAQISLIINTNIASRLACGSVSWITYADRLMEFPTALLGVALGTVLLPHLSLANAEGRSGEVSQLLDWGMRLACLLALPASLALWLLAQPLTATLFHYGKFTAADVTATQHAVTAYGVGLIGLILVKILAPGFYARQDIRTPVRIGVVVLIGTQLMNLAFVPVFQHAGLALAIGLGACLNAALLFVGLRRKGIYRPRDGWPSFALRLVFALVLLGVFLWWAEAQFSWIALREQPARRIVALGGIIVGGSALYFGALFAAGLRLADLRRSG
jgi:putative peptidoglycan lipid II flippase